jgi:integrase/recombinase XerD
MSQAKVLSELELKRVLAVVQQSGKHASRNRLVVLLTHLAGLRAGEIAALRIGDVLGEDGKPKDRMHLAPDQTKGSHGRTVLVSKRLQKEIAACLARRRWNSLEAPLIRSQKGGHFSPTTMVMLFRHMYDAAGLEDARSHSGRRTFITTLANKGISVRVIQALAGHQSMQTTQRYIDLNEGMMMAAVEAL